VIIRSAIAVFVHQYQCGQDGTIQGFGPLRSVGNDLFVLSSAPLAVQHPTTRTLLVSGSVETSIVTSTEDIVNRRSIENGVSWSKIQLVAGSSHHQLHGGRLLSSSTITPDFSARNPYSLFVNDDETVLRILLGAGSRVPIYLNFFSIFRLTVQI
jgi:hypothetical protein